MKKTIIMKAQRLSKWGFSILCISLLFTINAFASGDEISKDIQKSFDFSTENTLLVENKYGDIKIENWDKDKVDIQATITVEHSNADKAQEMLDYIHVEIFQDGNIIKAITDIDDKINKSIWFSIGNGDRKYKINYNIKLPSYANVDLSNKYGDVFINELSGHAQIHVKYGNLKANKLTRSNNKPLNHIELGYSNGWIEEASWMKLTLKYTPKMQIQHATALIVVSRYSKLYVDECSSIVADAKYDDYRIGDTRNFVGEMAYTDLNINSIAEKLDLVTRYGDADIENVPANFDKIRVDNKYGSIEIGIDESAHYKLTGEAQYGDIDYPESNRISKIKESTRLNISGYVGDEKTNSEVWIETKYGSVELD